MLLDERSRHVGVLTGLGALIWRCFDGVGSLEEIADDLAAETGRDADTVRVEVVEFARDLGRQGFLRGVEPEVGDTDGPLDPERRSPAPNGHHHLVDPPDG